MPIFVGASAIVEGSNDDCHVRNWTQARTDIAGAVGGRRTMVPPDAALTTTTDRLPTGTEGLACLKNRNYRPFAARWVHASPEVPGGRCGVAGRERVEWALGGPQQRNG